MTDSPETPKSSGTTALLDSIRDAFDDIAERATPAVREVSARAAELTAVAAAKAGPFAKKAGAATADASDKLADRSRSWAAGVRAAMDSEAPTSTSADGATGWGDTTITDAPPSAPSNGSTGEASNGSNGSTGDAPATDH
jgi:hypothetical protein